MGGSGGGFFSSGGSSEPTCAELRFRTTIINPNLDILQNVNIDDILDIELISDEIPAVITKTKSGDVVGSITPSEIARLLECLSKNNTYTATVVDIDSPRCEILVKHAFS